MRTHFCANCNFGMEISKLGTGKSGLQKRSCFADPCRHCNSGTLVWHHKLTKNQIIKVSHPEMKRNYAGKITGQSSQE